MSKSSQANQLTFVLFAFVAVLIIFPSVLFGVVQEWQIIFLLLGYLGFFFGLIWRVWKYGKLQKTSLDAQFQQVSGQWILAFLSVGICCLHWLAIYDFSRLPHNTENAIQSIWSVIAMILLGAAITVNQAAIRKLKGFFDRISIKPDHRLITTGIYSQVRHPIYFSYVLLLAGYCTMLQSFASLVLMAVICTIWLGNRIDIEEKLLLERFGNEYKVYQQRTKKIIPFIY